MSGCVGGKPAAQAVVAWSCRWAVWGLLVLPGCPVKSHGVVSGAAGVEPPVGAPGPATFTGAGNGAADAAGPPAGFRKPGVGTPAWRRLHLPGCMRLAARDWPAPPAGRQSR